MSVSTPTVIVLPVVLPELPEVPELPELPELPVLPDVPPLGATVVAEDPDFEELLHPATNTRAAAATNGIFHLLRTMFTTPLADSPYRNDSRRTIHVIRTPMQAASRGREQLFV
jgi:hypothetical protein